MCAPRFAHRSFLDLSQNLIANSVGIRTLSCNLNLKSLKMKGNPISETRGYRPTVICLLPHVKSIDGKSLPRTGGVKRMQQPPSSPPKKPRPATRSGDKENDEKKLEIIKKQAEADRKRMLSYHTILKHRAEEPEYAKVKGPPKVTLSVERQEELLQKLTKPIHPVKKKIELGHSKLAFGRSIPKEDLAKPKSAKNGGATSIEALKARLKAAKAGSGGAAKKAEKVVKKKEPIDHDVSDDIAQLHKEVMRLQEMQETGLSLVQAQEKHLSDITGDLAETRSRLSVSPNKVLGSSGGSLSAVDLLSSFTTKAPSIFARREITEWVREMEVEYATSSTALSVLVDMKRRGADDNTLSEYRKTLEGVGVFGEVKIPR